MAKQVISVGLTANDGTGDSLRTGAQKINDNFTELYTFLGNPATGQLSMVATVRAGPGITIDNPSGNVTITSRIATTNTIGSVKVDGETVFVANDGTISTNIRSDRIINGDYAVVLDNNGNLLLPSTAFGTGNILADINSYPFLLSYGNSEHGGPELTWLGSDDISLINDASVFRSTMWINHAGLTVALDANSSNGNPVVWTFDSLGVITLPANGDIVDSNGNSLFAGQYDLPTASTSVLGGVKVDGTTVTINETGVISAAPQYELPTASTSTLGGVKVDGSTINIDAGVISATPPSRSTISGTSQTLAEGESGTFNIVGYKSYVLFKIQVSGAAWVTLYTDDASRLADASRLETTDPLPGSGVVAEVITTGAETIIMSPATIGFNNESILSSNIPVKVVNKGVGSAAIIVTLTVLRIEG